MQTQGHPQELTTNAYVATHTYIWVKRWKQSLKTLFVFQFRLSMHQHWWLKFWKRLGSIILHLYRFPFWKACSYSARAVQIWYILTNRLKKKICEPQSLGKSCLFDWHLLWLCNEQLVVIERLASFHPKY